MERRFRRAARLVAVDSTNRVLLFRYAPPTGEWFWATPGGGLEGDESFEQAAEREAGEELGVSGVRLEPLWERESDFRWGEQEIRQEERYYLVRVEPQGFSEEVMEVHRQESILEARWWTVAELESSEELIFPEDLASKIRRAIERGRGSDAV